MSCWNSKEFLKFISKCFFGNRGTNYRLTGKRLGFLLRYLVLYLPAELLIWSGLALDELCCPASHHIKIHQPVIIIGNPPSGTTILQRLFARDRKNFLSMKTREIYRDPLFQTAPPILDLDRIRETIVVSVIGFLFLGRKGGGEGWR